MTSGIILTPDGIDITSTLRTETAKATVKTEYVFSMLDEHLEDLPEKSSPQYLRATIRRLKKNLTEIEDLLGLLVSDLSNEYDD